MKTYKDKYIELQNEIKTYKEVIFNLSKAKDKLDENIINGTAHPIAIAQIIELENFIENCYDLATTGGEIFLSAHIIEMRTKIKLRKEFNR